MIFTTLLTITLVGYLTAVGLPPLWAWPLVVVAFAATMFIDGAGMQAAMEDEFNTRQF